MTVFVGRVGVLGRVPPAVGVLQVAEHVVDRLAGHLTPHHVVERQRRMRVHPGEQRLVVQHLLEVGHQPALVDRIAGEAAAEVVVDAAGCHRSEAGVDHRARLGVPEAHERAQHQVDAHRRWELGCVAEPTPLAVERPGELAHTGLDQVGARGSGGRLHRRRASDRLDERAGVLLDVGGSIAPHVVDRAHQLQELRAREVGAAVERCARRRHEHRHRPAPTPRHGLHRVHVHRVDVGTFLAVDLHVHEQPVHHLGDLGVLEALVRHDVAPVAGAVADAQQDRDVALRRRGEGLGSPRVPVDRVVAMLPKVWRRLVGQPVHRVRVPTPSIPPADPVAVSHRFATLSLHAGDTEPSPDRRHPSASCPSPTRSRHRPAGCTRRYRQMGARASPQLRRPRAGVRRGDALRCITGHGRAADPGRSTGSRRIDDRRHVGRGGASATGRLGGRGADGLDRKIAIGAYRGDRHDPPADRVAEPTVALSPCRLAGLDVGAPPAVRRCRHRRTLPRSLPGTSADHGREGTAVDR